MRLQASSILEVTVSMVLILAIFSTALLIYLNVVSSHPQLRRFKYEAYLAKIAREAVRDKSLINIEWKEGSATIYKTATAYNGNPDLIHLAIKAEDDLGKVIAQHNILVYAPQP